MRLIDADILMEKIRCNRNGNCKECDFFTYGDTWCDGKIFGTTIMQATTVDAVPVIRCKDCKYWNNEHDIHWCNNHSHFRGEEWTMFDEDDYCSYGERKEDA